MRTLAVAGCSYSDHTEVDKTYGEYLAERIKYNYLHCARGGSSNTRSLFKLSKAILTGELRENDIIILQYTDPHRKLLPSIAPYEPIVDVPADEPGRIEEHETEYGIAYTSDYKIGSYQWQAEKENRELHLALENYAHNAVFEMEYMSIQHRMFEALCNENRILLVPLLNRYVTYIPLNRRGSGDVLADITNSFGPKVRNRVFNERDFIRPGNAENPSEFDLGWDNAHSYYDGSHLSCTGHQTIAEHLSIHLKQHKLLTDS